ncbi:magnesium-translocating P-type ATPase [Planococcus sp. SSTMD024]|uniref:magnesium-translocating P-type ATPase n=1 Tax=Planococcus sp. SSTMD024 TaxID=3242163 RepID=UPI00351E52D8
MRRIPTSSYWSAHITDILDDLQSSYDGITEEEAGKRLKEYGENLVRDERKTARFLMLLSQFKSPIIIILIAATIISAATGDWVDSTIILVIILASATLSFFQEYSASKALEELRAKVQVKSVVLRNGLEKEIASKEVVPGDILKVSTGSLIPSDGLVLEAENFFVNQSLLTGESMPAEKRPGLVHENATLEERTNCVFTGTNVQSGSAVILAIQTGEATEFGQIAKKLTLRSPETDFEKGIRHFGYLLTKIMLTLTLAVFAINVLLERPVLEALLFSVAIAVGITPQLLSAIISITLSQGSKSMGREGVIVRRLTAIENLGSMDVLCTDKTGTLTEGAIRLDGTVDPMGQPSENVFKLAYVNASLQSGMKNALDETIISSKKMDLGSIRLIDEIPYDFSRKRLSVVVLENSEAAIVTKGALNQVLEICTQVQMGDYQQALDPKALEDIQSRYESWGNQGFRVLGVARKSVAIEEEYGTEAESGMVFTGFLLFFDHPKKGISKTIQNLEVNGVSLRIITGDNKWIALHTAKSVGLHVDGILTGHDLMQMNEGALLNKLGKTTIFAEVDPNQKERIILAFKKKQHVVGYMGDGINDIPAIHASDVSISVDNAVDIAKESADFVLMQKSLEVLNTGIVLGRTTFANTLKYIMVTTSANFGNMFSMAGASLFLPFLPLLPKQILMINFLSDFPALAIAKDSVDAETLRKPRKWDIRLIRNFMFIFGMISSVFDYIAFSILFIGFRANQAVFQTSWFSFSILTELLILMVMRTRLPFFKSRPAPILLYSSIAVALIAYVFPYLPINRLLRIEPVDPWITLALIGTAFLYIIVTEIAKYHFFRAHS